MEIAYHGKPLVIILAPFKDGNKRDVIFGLFSQDCTQATKLDDLLNGN